MQRFALAPAGPTRERVLVAIPRRAPDWTIARCNRGMHRLLVPIDESLQGVGALRYIVDQLGDHVEDVHLVNVQRPVMSGDVTALVAASTIVALRRAAGERVLALARESLADSAIPTSVEVAFGAPAKTICGIAQARGCTGIVIGKDGLELHDLIGRSVAARILRLATVPVTIVSAATAAAIADGGKPRPRRSIGAQASARPDRVDPAPSEAGRHDPLAVAVE
jgi:nucleotide-binding universal stress UspA family protein